MSGIDTHIHAETPHTHTVYIFITRKITKQIKTGFMLVNRRHKKQTFLISYKQAFSPNSSIAGGTLTVNYP